MKVGGLLLLLAAVQQSLPAQDSAGSAGAGQVSTYVLLSGIVGGKEGMTRLADRLKQDGHRVFVIDPYQESLDSTDVSFAALARRVDRLLDKENILHARVIGHGHGGAVGLRLASSYPSRVRELFLLDVGALRISKTRIFSGSVKLIPLLVRIPGGRSLVERRFKNGIRENLGKTAWFDRATQRRYVSLVLDTPHAIAMASRLAKAAEPEPVETVVNRIAVPVTVIKGGAPHSAAPDPSELEVLAALGCRFQLVTLSDVGHFPHEESPGEVANVVTATVQTDVAVEAHPDRNDQPYGIARCHVQPRNPGGY